MNYIINNKYYAVDFFIFLGVFFFSFVSFFTGRKLSSLVILQAIAVMIAVSGIIKNDAVPLSIILVNSIANTLELIIILKLYWKSWK